MGLYNIPLGSAFLKTLAQGIIERVADDPIKMGQMVVLLPTRRGCLSLKEILQEKAKQHSLILPRIYALADLEQNPMLPGLPLIEVPASISKWERLGKLTQLVQQFLQQKNLCDSVAISYPLAEELAILLDEFYISGVPLTRLETLVEADFSSYWQQNLTFLKIISDFWPTILQERQLVEAAQQSQENLRYIAAHWNPSFPVILAGTTGTRPATAELAKKILNLPQGMIVLPGYNDTIDPASLSPTHPHYTLSQFVAYLGRDKISEWVPSLPHESQIKRKFLEAAMAPILDHQQTFSLEDCRLLEERMIPIECNSMDQEAMTIAALLRQSYETATEKAVVITPDQALTKRIQSYLKRWGIEVNTSNGTPLARTVVGTFLTLVSKISDDMSIVDWLSLLKHPLFLKTKERGAHLQLVRQLEVKVYRKKRGLTITEIRFLPDELKEWYQTILEKISPLLERRKRVPFAEWLKLHQGVSLSLAGEFLWSGDDGEIAREFMEDLSRESQAFSILSRSDYEKLFRQLMQGISVHNKKGIGSPLRILGTLEARQVEADVVILAGLNEGIWPQGAEEGAWLSNQMRLKLGLPDSSRRLGLAAHDFCLGFAAPCVYLTRSKKVQGTAAVPSRLWQRFHTVAKINHLSFRGMGSFRKLVDELDIPDSFLTSPPPCPKPTRLMKPDQLSVTDVERLMRDPYSLYARKILKLQKLDALDQPLSGREWGQLVHECLEKAFKQYPITRHDDFMAVLIRIGESVFVPYFNDIIVQTFWWHRYLQICEWIQKSVLPSLQNVKNLKTEVVGTLELKIKEDLITLKTIADRIDEYEDGEYHIVDYKTGTLPTIKDVQAGFSPQLSLEGLILKKGGFLGLSAMEIESSYWHLKGGLEGGVVRKTENYDHLINQAEEGLIALLEYFYNDEAVFLACPWGEDKATLKDYFHLSRLEEWMAD